MLPLKGNSKLVAQGAMAAFIFKDPYFVSSNGSGNACGSGCTHSIFKSSFNNKTI